MALAILACIGGVLLWLAWLFLLRCVGTIAIGLKIPCGLEVLGARCLLLVGLAGARSLNDLCACRLQHHATPFVHADATILCLLANPAPTVHAFMQPCKL